MGRYSLPRMKHDGDRSGIRNVPTWQVAHRDQLRIVRSRGDGGTGASTTWPTVMVGEKEETVSAYSADW